MSNVNFCGGRSEKPGASHSRGELSSTPVWDPGVVAFEPRIMVHLRSCADLDVIRGLWHSAPAVVRCCNSPVGLTSPAPRNVV
jgi:hypothetical protein